MTPHFNYRADAPKQFVTLCVAQRFCDVSEIQARLESTFRPSATYFEGSKYAKSWLRFRPDFVGFLRPDTDPGVAATGHPWPGAANSASMPSSPRISARAQPSLTSHSASSVTSR
ncbi:hypothetical protein ALQ32_04599 [Pseudomonas syringae pv. tagetis]|uniref:Uncharacterized protein n=1 Tax=Pseudomonas syringae pv. tagetis TaxID=129140 RepID=A0A3M3Z7X6_9PSED|nr:hypothetical protein ALQ32_04599 [Pseudomonas syringae pv. tagetis]